MHAISNQDIRISESKNKDFWLGRWQQNLIGFHQAHVSPALGKYINRLQIAPGDSVLLPLCGKSHDLEWLHQQGHKVIGIEYSPIAAKDFFSEQNRHACITTSGKFESYHSADIEILCGDFFDLTSDNVPDISAVFDRASLIALPAALRAEYVSKMVGLIAPGTRILLVSLDYPLEEMDGPPYSVDEEEVQDLYGSSFSINVLEQLDILSQEPKFRERGLSRLTEKVYLLQKY